MLNIPIYRAKKIDSDEYVEGFLIPPNPDMQDGIVTFEEAPMEIDTGHVEVYTKTHKIDQSTLAIHFPDMVDSEENKIFASLNEDGKNGDIIVYAGQRIGTAIYRNGEFIVGKILLKFIIDLSRETKVIGMQE